MLKPKILLASVLSVISYFFSPLTSALVSEGHQVMISAPSQLAVDAGREIALRGGNVVDIAVGVGLTLSVTSPYYAALGGGGFALVKMSDIVEALDFRETAPKKTHAESFVKLDPQASITGGKAVAVPGYPAGLFALHKKYGKLPWKSLFKFPLRLAQAGFPVSGEWVQKTTENLERFNPSGSAILRKSSGLPFRPGENLTQEKLARALMLFRDKKTAGFYSGLVAQDLVKSVNAAGGELTLADLESYKVLWRSPTSTTYEGHKIYFMPLPSSGGVVLHTALSLMERLKLKTVPLYSLAEFHLLSEIQSRAFRSRSELGDPDFFKNPLQDLLADSFLEKLTESVSKQKSVALPPLNLSSKPETDSHSKDSAETTHFTVVDNEGKAVSLTVTLNGSYGSGVISSKFGIALNNQMDDFTTRPGVANMYGLIQGKANQIEPGKRPLSSMTPTIVEKNGKTIMALGAPGGPRIISGILQVLYRVLAREQDLDLAIQAPRVHHQYQPHTVFIDRQRFSPEILEGLRKKGHSVEESWMGKVYAVKLRADGILEGAFDSRGEGAAGGI